MTMPTDVGIIDLMLGIPSGHERDWYEFLKPQLREESKDYEFPAQYMFKDVPHLDPRTIDPSRRRSARWTTTASSKAMVGVGFERNRRHCTGASKQHPDRFFALATRSTRTRAWRASATS